jgi:hypothetical protein
VSLPPKATQKCALLLQPVLWRRWLGSIQGKSSFLLLLCSVCFAATGAHAGTIAAASCSQNDVASAVSSASDGDVVSIPACSNTWTSSSTPPVAFCKSITLQGAGAGATNISINNTGSWPKAGIYVNNCTSKNIRITGFSLSYVSGDAMIFFNNSVGSTVRIDHMSLNGGSSGGDVLYVYGPYGVADHNTFTNSSTLIERPASGDALAGDSSWSQDPSFGTANAFYFEDNTFNDTVYTEKDCIDGGREVYRNNTFTSYGPFTHGFDTVPRSCFELDAYNNTFTGKGYSPYYGFRYRGGSGLLYNNLIQGTYSMAFIQVENYRSYSTGYVSPYTDRISPHWCDGGSNYDENTALAGTYHGWPCRDQIGRGKNQGSYPLYSWNNCRTALGCGVGDQATITVAGGGGTDYTASQIMANRDFYQMVAGFNGTTGVGQGTLAARPSTCSVNSDTGKGPAYWATDQNRLYQCSATNTWTLYYVPFAYPHPLVGAAAAGVQPPMNVTAVVR